MTVHEQEMSVETVGRSESLSLEDVLEVGDEFHFVGTVPWRGGNGVVRQSQPELCSTTRTPVRQFHPSQLAGWWSVGNRPGKGSEHLDPDREDHIAAHDGDGGAEHGIPKGKKCCEGENGEHSQHGAAPLLHRSIAAAGLCGDGEVVLVDVVGKIGGGLEVAHDGQSRNDGARSPDG